MDLLFILKNYPICSAIFSYFGYKVALKLLFLYRYRCYIYKNKIQSNMIIYFWNIMRVIPTVQHEIEKNIDKTTADVEQSLNCHEFFNNRTILKNEGSYPKNIISTMKNMLNVENKIVNKNKVSGTIYSFDVDHNRLLEQVFPLFNKTNPLHPDIFLSVRKMETDIIHICKNLTNGYSQARGNITSGGTESILCAMRAYRERSKDKLGVTCPEMIVFHGAHAAFDKSADYFKIKLIRIPPELSENDRIRMMKDMITSNTICVVASAPEFANGLMDNIHKIAEVCLEYKVPLHVDACLGGFILPFINTRHSWNFALEGVTSISMDLHKYAYCPKGISIILYRSREYSDYSGFVKEDWNGGIYATHSTMGSRCGNIVAQSWATLMYYGIDGYKLKANKIQQAVIKIRDEFRYRDDIYVIGEPDVCVVAFASHTLDIYKINDKMKANGWFLNELQYPAAIHICVTQNHIPYIEQFIIDLNRAIGQVRDEQNQDINGLEGDTGEGASIYGTAQKVSDRRIVKQITINYLDLLYK